LVAQVQAQATAKQTIDATIFAPEPLDPADALRVLEHPLPRWVERLTTAALEAGGGKAVRSATGTWDLTWPSGERRTNVVFDARQIAGLSLPASNTPPVPPDAISIPAHPGATGATGTTLSPATNGAPDGMAIGQIGNNENSTPPDLQPDAAGVVPAILPQLEAPTAAGVVPTLRPQSPWSVPCDRSRRPKGDHISIPIAGEQIYIGIADPHVQALLAYLPITVEGQPIPCLHVPGLPAGVDGIWSIWQITLYEQSISHHLAGAPRNAGGGQHHLFPLFVHDNGRLYLPTARHLWDALLAASPAPHRHLLGEDAVHAYTASRAAAEEHGAGIYTRLVHEREERHTREQARATEVFAARRRVVERLGLPAVRAHRLAALATEEAAWLAADTPVAYQPDLATLLLLRIEAAGGPA
jgi:hypothetical protein